MDYRDNPFPWGRAARQHRDPVRYASAIEVGHRSIWVRIGMWFARWL